jgi:hypothetical protein
MKLTENILMLANRLALLGMRLIAKCLRWSPLGNPVEISIDEAGDKTLSRRVCHGRLISVNDSGLGAIRLNSPLLVGERFVEIIYARPRHENYPFDRLIFSWIAVYLIADLPEEQKNIFAIASIRLRKRETGNE